MPGFLGELFLPPGYAFLFWPESSAGVRTQQNGLSEARWEGRDVGERAWHLALDSVGPMSGIICCEALVGNFSEPVRHL